jgi:hypothetical protein
MKVFTVFLNMLLPHRLGQIRYGTTMHGEELLLQEDLA